MNQTKSPLPAITVVICAYADERWGCLMKAIDSVRDQTQPPQEILVVIDHNSNLYQRLRHYRPEIAAVENYEARGLSGGRNTGIARAHGEAIAFLDDDAEAAPDWLEKLSRWFQDPNVIGVGGKVEPNWESAAPAWFPNEFGWVVGCSYLGQPEQSARVRNLFGGCMCVRREAFTVAGGFRGSIGRSNGRPMGCEETELCIRVQQRNPDWYFVYEPQARIYHRVPAARASWDYFCQRCYAEGLSKAQVSQLVGASDGLSTEFSYTLRTLPIGVLRGLGQTLTQRNLQGLRQAGAIVGGLVYTLSGYVAGRRELYLGQRSRVAPQT